MKAIVKHSIILGIGMAINVLGLLMMSWLLTPDSKGLMYIFSLVFPPMAMYLVAGLLVPEEWVKVGEYDESLEESLPNDGFSSKDDMRRVMANLVVSAIGATVIGVVILQVVPLGSTSMGALLGMYLPYMLPYGYLMYRTMAHGKLKEDKKVVMVYAVNVVISMLGIVLTGSFYTDTMIVGFLLALISCGVAYQLHNLVDKESVNEESEKLDLTKETDLA